MIKIKNTDVYGAEAAVRGMRNPMNSWNKSDSRWDEAGFIIGNNDLDLMKRLIKGGTEHRKFLRMINVTVDITAPLYWWKEFDTYKVGTVANSCSTMHKIHEKEFTLDDFSCEHLLNAIADGPDCTDLLLDISPYKDGSICYSPSGVLILTIDMLNRCRTKFLETNDKKYWWQMIQLLPSSYNQKRTIQLNYEVLFTQYHQRLGHKLDEWNKYCKWIESLPYITEFLEVTK